MPDQAETTNPAQPLTGRAEVEWLRGCYSGERGTAQRIRRASEQAFTKGDDQHAKQLRQLANLTDNLALQTVRTTIVRAAAYNVPLTDAERKLLGAEPGILARADV